MTAQYTQTNNLSPSNLMVDIAASVKISSSDSVDGTAFSSALDNASKNYTDKSELKTNSKSDNNYSKGTKEIKSQTPENKDIDTDKIEQDTKENNAVNKKENTRQITKEKSMSEEETSSCVDVDEVQKSEEIEQSSIFDESKTVDELLEQIKNNVCIITTDSSTDSLSVEEVSEDIKTAVESASVNKIVNEKLLSNIEYEPQSEANITDNLLKPTSVNIEDLSAKNTSIEINTDTISVKECAKTTSNTESVNITNNQDDLDTDINRILNTEEEKSKTVSFLTKENNSESDNKTNTLLKTAQESLASDTSRLTANIEEYSENDLTVQETKPITPLDTKQQEQDLEIKVTDEVASQIHRNNTSDIESKDLTSKVKDKAVETMTALKNKDTTVTDVKTSDSGSDTESSLNQNNANETAAKLNVQDNTSGSQTTSAESFVNKLDTQLSMNQSTQKGSVQLNQNDILSQINAKFEQLQQQSSNKVSIVLQPESLGKVSVEIMNTKEGIVAKMTAESNQVKELFDKSLDSLKNSLAAQGVNVNSIKVESTQESSNNAMDFERNQFEQAFNNQQNGQNHSNKSQQTAQEQNGFYAKDSQQESENKEEITVETGIDSTENTNNYNGKVDYIV